MATQNEEECNSDLLPFDIWLYNNLKSFKYDIIRRLAHRRGADKHSDLILNVMSVSLRPDFNLSLKLNFNM